MAVTTEPPWLNMTSGTSARNGTASRTITFGWTAGTGTLVVVVVGGAVTNSAAGWTERLQPVSSGELSVFTATGAGQTSIAVTNNGSDFPEQWVAYEFPSSSTYTTGIGSTPTTDTFPALTGLPGTAQVIIAGRFRNVTTGATAGSSTWTAPWVKDADLYTGVGSAEGAYLTVGHQLNVTATSITPAATTTYSGTWSATDREHVVAAFNVAATGAAVATPIRRIGKRSW